MMKFLSSAFVLFLALGALWFYKSSNTQKSISIENNGTLMPLPCDLNKQSCKVTFGNDFVNFKIFPTPVHPMKQVWLSVDAPMLKAPSVRAYGLNMDMGVIDIKLTNKDGIWLGEMALSACVIDVMRYRFEVLEDGRDIGLFIDFDMRL